VIGNAVKVMRILIGGEEQEDFRADSLDSERRRPWLDFQPCAITENVRSVTSRPDGFSVYICARSVLGS
jgi:hypothetical protein